MPEEKIMRSSIMHYAALGCAAVIGAAALAAPVQAKPSGHPTSNTPTTGSGCFVSDANDVSSFESSCSFHLTWQTDTDGNMLAAMYNDHGQLPAGAAFPTSTIRRDISFDNVRTYVRTAAGWKYAFAQASLPLPE